jgi:hypothetical protein
MSILTLNAQILKLVFFLEDLLLRTKRVHIAILNQENNTKVKHIASPKNFILVFSRDVLRFTGKQDCAMTDSF